MLLWMIHVGEPQQSFHAEYWTVGIRCGLYWLFVVPSKNYLSVCLHFVLSFFILVLCFFLFCQLYLIYYLIYSCTLFMFNFYSFDLFADWLNKGFMYIVQSRHCMFCDMLCAFLCFTVLWFPADCWKMCHMWTSNYRNGKYAGMIWF